MKVTIKLIAVLLLPLLLFAACSTGNNGNSTSKINIKFIDKKTGKTVAAATTLPPAGIETLALTVTPASTTAATIDGSAAVPGGAAATPASQSLTTATMSDMISKLGDWAFQTITMDDNKTYLFDITAKDKSGVILYAGSVLQTMKPGANTVNINCSTYAAATSAASWSAKTAMPTARSRAASAQVGGKIYVIGGEGAASVPVNTLEAYDPATNTWTTLAPMPAALRYSGAAAIGTDIFVIGGEDANAIPTSTVYIFDTIKGTWSTYPFSMPTARARLSCVAYGGAIYAIGGTDASGAVPLNTVEILYPAINNWSTAPSLVTARARFSAVVRPDSAGGTVISVFGGDTTTGSTSTHETLKLTPIPATSWNTSTIPLPAARTRFGAALAGTSVYVIGGEEPVGTLTANNLSANFSSASTPTFAAVPASGTFTTRAYPVVQSVNGKVYVIGGAVASGTTFVASNAVEELTPAGTTPKIGKSVALGSIASVNTAEIDGINMVLVGQQTANGPLFIQKINSTGTTISPSTALNIIPSISADPEAQMAIGSGKIMLLAPEASGLFVSILDSANPTTVVNKMRVDTAFPSDVNRASSIAFDGTNFLVVWSDATNIIYASVISPTGSIVAPASSIGSGNVIKAAFGNDFISNGYYLVLTGDVFMNAGISSASINGIALNKGTTSLIASGNIISATVPGTVGSFWGDITFNGSGFGVVAHIGDGINDYVYFNTASTSITQPVIFKGQQVIVAPGTSGSKQNAECDWDGFKWIITWFQTDAINGSMTGYYRFYDTNGTPLNSATAFTPALSGNAGGKAWWSSSLNSYILAWGSQSSSFSMALMQP